MRGTDIAGASVASIRTPRASDGCQARNPTDFGGRKARCASQSTERVAQRSEIKERHQDGSTLVICESLGNAFGQSMSLYIIGHYGKYRGVLRRRNAG